MIATNRHLLSWFGFTTGAVLAYSLIRQPNGVIYIVLLSAAAALGLAALIAPRALAPLNRLWSKLGQLMGKVVSPIALGIIYFGLVTPTALIARLLGRDELHLRRRATQTYWINREPPGPTAQSFENQF